MSIPYLGDFAPGAVVRVPFHTFDTSTAASITMTGFATTDIKIYKNGLPTVRSGVSGYTLADTDGTDFDSLTGLHGFLIDTGDDSDAGFFTAGADYWVAVSSVTVSGVAISFWAATFSIENRRVVGELESTTIATLASQTSFTLSAGSADDNAYLNCIAIVTDNVTAAQKCIGYISAYTGATKTITLRTDPGIFTMAVGDNVSIVAISALSNPVALGGQALTVAAPVTVYAAVGSDNKLDVSATGEAGLDFDNINQATAPTVLANISVASAQEVIGAVGELGATAQSQVNAQVLDVLTTDTYTELGQGSPPSTSSLANMLRYLYKGWRNKNTNDGSYNNLYNDAGTVIDQKATVSEAGGVSTKGKVTTGA